MKEARFKNLSYKERRNRLAAELRKKSKNILTDKEIDMIVKSLNVNVQYNLQLVRSAKEMHKALILLKHDSASGDYISRVRGYGKVLLGKAGFVLMGTKQRPVLNHNEKAVVSLETHYITSFKSLYTETKKVYRIVIYIPI